MNEDLTTFIEPELEARIVALVLGEASAFEREELERVIAERPEARIFKARMEALHGFIDEASNPVDAPDWKLSSERRETVLAKIREGRPEVVAPPVKERKNFRRRLIFYGSAACFIALAAGLATSSRVQSEKSSDTVLMTRNYSEEIQLQGGSDMIIPLPSSAILDEALASKPADSNQAWDFEFADDGSQTGTQTEASASDLLAQIDGDYREEPASIDNGRSTRSRGRFDSQLRTSTAVVDEAAFGLLEGDVRGLAEKQGNAQQESKLAGLDGQTASSDVNERMGGLKKNLSAYLASGNEGGKASISEDSLAYLGNELNDLQSGLPNGSNSDVLTSTLKDDSRNPNGLLSSSQVSSPIWLGSVQSFFDDTDSLKTSDTPVEGKVATDWDSDGYSPPELPNQVGEAIASNGGVQTQDQETADDLGLLPDRLDDSLAFLPESRTRQAVTDAPAKPLERKAVTFAEMDGLEAAAEPKAENKKREFGRENADFIDTVDRVQIPGIPAAPEQTVAGIVTAGNRSGAAAVDRNSIDAILNNPDRTAGNEKGQEIVTGQGSNYFLGGGAGGGETGKPIARGRGAAGLFGVEKDSVFADDIPDVKAPRGLGGDSGGGEEPEQLKVVAKQVDVRQNNLEELDFEPPSATDAGELAKQENLRRQATVETSDELLRMGREAYANGDYETATSKYRESLENLPPGTATEDRRKVIADHLQDGSLALTQTYRRTGKYDEARELLTELERSDPGNEVVKKELEYLDDPIRTNPALTYEHTKNVDKVRRNLYTGEGFYDLGQYDKAEENFKEILRIDPYNKAARRWLERTSAIKSDYYRAAYDHTRAEMLAEVNEAWELETPAVAAQEALTSEEIESIPLYDDSLIGDEKSMATSKKLNEIILPELDLTDVTVEEAMEIIKAKAKEADLSEVDEFARGVDLHVKSPLVVGEKEGTLDGGADPNQIKIKKLNLRNVPLRVALQYVADESYLRYKVDESGVTLLPVGADDTADIVQRRFVVPDTFASFLSSSGGSGDGDADPFGGDEDESGNGLKPRLSIVDLLKNSGVTFPDNASASFLKESNTLIVRSTPTNLDLIDGIVKAAKDDSVTEDLQKKKELIERETFETSTSQNPDSTFSLNVSDVSFKLTKSSLSQGQWPEASKVRPEEFVNALSYGDDTPSQAEKVACVIEQGSHPFMQQRNLMRVSMSTAALGRNASTPLRLTILLDQSGSMERADRAESVRRAFELLAAQLNENDEITLVGFARTPRLLAQQVKGNDSAKLAQIVANPLTEGGTNLEAALSSGLQLARQQFVEGAQNRIILLTDGAANLGDALPENLSKQVASMREAGIAFDACGVGADGLNDDILTSLTKQGDGRYYFLDRPEDADSGFARQIAGALRPAAKNVKVQVIFNPERVSKFKLYGFEKHQLKKEDFRNDSVDAAEMAAEESGVALYHFEPIPDGEGDVGTVSVRFLDTATDQMVERTWSIPYQPESANFSEAQPTFRLASVAGLFAEKLMGSPVGERVELKRLRQEIELLKPSFNNQSRFQELHTMLQQAGE